MNMLRHLLSILALPFVVLVLIPWGLLAQPGGTHWPFGLPLLAFPMALGLALIALGILLLATTVRLFATRGRGTLAPWDPPKKLVVGGPYRYVRNPMISGVWIALFGESLFLGSLLVAVWALLFLLINHTYFVLLEEPGLAARFGKDYQTYRANVPRWLPRRSPWEGNS